MKETEFLRVLAERYSVASEGTLGIGDDCCTWFADGEQCLSTDCVVEDRHFAAEDRDEEIGRKAAGAAVSDLAAMGAAPTGAVVALQLPHHRDGLAVMDGCRAELDRHGCPLLGGDTVGADALAVTVTVWGRHGPGGRFLRRSGGRTGDLVVVTGPLGGSSEGGRHLRPEPRIEEGMWLAEQACVHAAIDCSDGLALDAGRIAAASGCACLLLPDRLPIHDDVSGERRDPVAAAMSDGEDFELILAVDAPAWPSLIEAWPFASPLVSVGWLTPGEGVQIEDDHGRVVPCPYTGYEHGAG